MNEEEEQYRRKLIRISRKLIVSNLRISDVWYDLSFLEGRKDLKLDASGYID